MNDQRGLEHDLRKVGPAYLADPAGNVDELRRLLDEAITLNIPLGAIRMMTGIPQADLEALRGECV
jgi:hypothetical protein